MLHIERVEHLQNYQMHVSFDDGSEGIVDLAKHLHGPMFEALKDVSFFARVTVDPELETVVWPNGLDLAPEFLKDCLV